METIAKAFVDGLAHRLRLTCLVPYERQRSEIVGLDPTASAGVCTVAAGSGKVVKLYELKMVESIEDYSLLGIERRLK